MPDLPRITESTNNAIVKMAYLSAFPQNVPNADVRASVQHLADHWQTFWAGTKRTVLPVPALESQLKAYVRWYARAFHLLPPALRSQLVAPAGLEPTWGKLFDEQAQRIREGAQNGGRAARALTKEITGAAFDLGVVVLLLGLGVALLAGGNRRG